MIPFLAIGCAHKKPAATPAPAPAVPEGKTTYSYIFDPSNPALGLPEDVQFSRPPPEDTTALPKYPDCALAAPDGPHREIVCIVIDTHGIVRQVLDSPRGQSDGGPFAEDYRRAVDADGKPDYKIVTSWDLVAVYYDIRCTFEIVAGKGVVKAAP